MKTAQYISQLLYRYQCVTIPGFGAFLTEIQSAQLQENTNSFYPPKKVVSFNAHLKNNDGLLANHIAQAEKISYENAVAFLENEVQEWRTILKEKGKFQIKNVGEIQLNAEHHMVFIPSDSTNYFTDSFGLNSFVSPVIKREVLSYLAEVSVAETPVVALFSNERKSVSYLKYAAVFIIALSATASIGYKMYENKIAEETLLVETAVQKQVQNKIQEATFVIKNPMPSVTLLVKEEKFQYHIMAGAFRSEENANRVLTTLTLLGFNARRIAPNKDGLFPVLYGSYTTYLEAQNALTTIHNTDNPDAWLLIKEL